ncbi:MAG: hypothetical protein AAF597_11980 [Bacteroidota bacterium]
MKPVIFLLLPILLFSCGSSRFSLPVRTKAVAEQLPPLSNEEAITVISLYEELPDNSSFLQKIAIGGNSLWRGLGCNYEAVMDEAVVHARQNGANIVKIIKPIGPRLGPCPRITFGLFRNDDPAAIAAYQEKQEAANASTLPVDADYAVVHFYRPAYSSASILGFGVFHERARIGRLGNNRKFSYQTTEFGPQRFFISSSQRAVTLNVQPGQEYYVSYMATAGVELEIPGLRRVDNLIGRAESKTAREYISRAARSSR